MRGWPITLSLGVILSPPQAGEGSHRTWSASNSALPPDGRGRMGGGHLTRRLAGMITVAFSQVSSPVHSKPVCGAPDLGFAGPM